MAFFAKAKSKSISAFRSCISSIHTCVYCDKNGSFVARRNINPGVIKSTVRSAFGDDNMDSNRIAYPMGQSGVPIRTFCSNATRLAAIWQAIRRGCDTATLVASPTWLNKLNMMGYRVVFPDPVPPRKIVTDAWFSYIVDSTLSTGNDVCSWCFRNIEMRFSSVVCRSSSSFRSFPSVLRLWRWWCTDPDSGWSIAVVVCRVYGLALAKSKFKSLNWWLGKLTNNLAIPNDESCWLTAFIKAANESELFIRRFKFMAIRCNACIVASSGCIS